MANEQQGTPAITQGRLVWTSGDLFKGDHQKDYNSKQPLFNQDGSPKIQYGFGLAVEIPGARTHGPDGRPYTEEDKQKIAANFSTIWNAIHTEAYSMFPSRQIPPAFAMKYKKPEDVNEQGIPYAQKPGYKDHYVFTCTTSLPIKYYTWGNGAYTQVNDGIKCGDYVQVHLNIKAHPAVGKGKAGLYVNPSAVLFLGAGEAIVNSPSPETLFGNQAPAMMPGVQTSPMGNAPMAPMPGQQPGFSNGPMTPSTSIPQPAQQYAPPAYGAPPVAEQPQAQPHYGVLPQAHQPQAQMPQYAPQQPVQQSMMPAAPQGMPQYQAPQPQAYAQPGAPVGMPTPGMPPYPTQR